MTWRVNFVRSKDAQKQLAGTSLIKGEIHGQQEFITRGVQLPYLAYVAEFLQTDLFFGSFSCKIDALLVMGSSRQSVSILKF